MLPEPTLTFTLPSIHDDTVLDCRVYHPFSLSPSPNAPAWKRHAAIVAHPYAPMGGCYDDPVVDTIGEALLRAGFLVGTFNFRGASKSAGKTSWTGRPEQSDYMSLVGFMIYYIHFLDPFSAFDSGASLLPPGLSPEPRPTETPPVLLCAGYSYGAMIASRIPPLDHILPNFAEPIESSAAADIRLRAQHLAEKQNSWLASARELRAGASPSRNVRIGGDEGEQRRSHDGRRSQSPHSEDKLRRGVGELLARTKARSSSFMSNRSVRSHKSAQAHHEETEPKSPKSPVSPVSQPEPHHLPAITDLVQVNPAYALISPPQGAVNHLLTLSFLHTSGPNIFSRTKQPSPDGQGARAEEGSDQVAAEVKLVRNPTLAVFGDRDGFNSAQKYRSWAKRFRDMDGSQFRAVEVSGAGHFYTEERALCVLRDAVSDFATGLLGHGGVR